MVKLSAEYGGLFPIRDAVGDAVAVHDPALRQQLIIWSNNFEKEFDHETGWSSVGTLLAHAERAYALLVALRVEFPGSLITWDIWETSYRVQSEDTQ